MKSENKFYTKQFFKLVTGLLFNLNLYELNKLLKKIKFFDIDKYSFMEKLLYEQEGMVLLDRLSGLK